VEELPRTDRWDSGYEDRAIVVATKADSAAIYAARVGFLIRPEVHREMDWSGKPENSAPAETGKGMAQNAPITSR
jgi:light-regulated signal transduction histidine kinase (bacteriophytochrome)